MIEFFKDVDLGAPNPKYLARQMVDALMNKTKVMPWGWCDPLYVLYALRLEGRDENGRNTTTNPPMHLHDAAVNLENAAYRFGPRWRQLCDTSLENARQIRRQVAEENAANAKFSAKRLRSMTVPNVRCANQKIGVNAIWWDEQGKTWNFGGYRIGVNKIARLIAITLLRGEEWVEIGGVKVTVDYLYDMVRITGSFGGFYDYVDDEFDPYTAPASPKLKPVYHQAE